MLESLLTKGDKVKVTLTLQRKRNGSYEVSNAHVLDDFAKMLEDIAQVMIRRPKLEGRNMTMFLEKKR